MSLSTMLPWMSECPQCNSTEDVYIYDEGLKFIRRLLTFNNRFACEHCNITWRRKKRYHTLRLRTKKTAEPEKRRDRPTTTRLFVNEDDR
ncbi:MAG: hypothetical protein GF418_04350 [Chitinivibrionales bacterium]|nr:hypothetical protein [Chitinivibrionales bacterium]MBD3394838.1 hypothetical protein [Chitinivibrionales bacterium]